MRLQLEGLRSDMLVVSEVTLPMLKNMEDEARVKREDAQRRLADKKAQLEAQVGEGEVWGQTAITLRFVTAVPAVVPV